MTKWKEPLSRMPAGTKLGLGAAALIAVGAAGGAGAVSMTRPSVEMAPMVRTAIAALPQSSGVVTVKGRVAGIYGKHILVQDDSGRALVDVGRNAATVPSAGGTLAVQGRFHDGQLRASYLVDQQGRVDAVGGPAAPPPPPGANEAAPPPPPPPGGPGAPPPPHGPGGPPHPAGGPCAAPPPPPPANGAVPPPPPAPAPASAQRR